MLKRWLPKAVLTGIAEKIMKPFDKLRVNGLNFSAVLTGIAFLLALVLVSCSGSQAKPVEAPMPDQGQPADSTSGLSPAASFVPYIPKGKPAKPVKQVPIDARVNGDSVSMLLNKVTSNLNTRFTLSTEEGPMTFMAYVWDGKLHVRADICPPCRSKSFTLTKDALVCDSCGTVFNASNGDGIKGACVAYPKESAPYQISQGNIIINKADLVNAYKETLKPSW